MPGEALPSPRRRERTWQQSQLTIGLDGGGRSHVCVLEDKREIVTRTDVATTRPGITTLFRAYAGATVVMEAGTMTAVAYLETARLAQVSSVGPSPRLRPLTIEDRRASRTAADRRVPRPRPPT